MRSICLAITFSFLFILTACNHKQQDSKLLEISTDQYHSQLEGFWLGQCIANWTGLVTEMDKIGNVGEIKTGDFYTREDWGQPDQPSIWAEGVPSDLSATIDFVFRDTSEVWGADDDTDLEYMYQHLLSSKSNGFLSPDDIRNGWLKHIKAEEENYLWVSNQKAFDLMKEGSYPPATGHPDNNEHFDMIDAQLTTEIFGLFAPGSPEYALQLAELPIQTTARGQAEHIARFYVMMHSLASLSDPDESMKARTQWMAKESSKILPQDGYAAKMYDYVWTLYQSSITWEQARDSVYYHYQVKQANGYDITSQNLYCNGCFAGGINFAAGLVSLFYGEGDFKETIKIGVLAGWDSDNPTATWGGLLGFMMGRPALEKEFGRKFSSKYNIHRTRQNFPNNGIDNFDNMAKTGVAITSRVITEHIGGYYDKETKNWKIPITYQD